MKEDEEEDEEEDEDEDEERSQYLNPTLVSPSFAQPVRWYDLKPIHGSGQI